MKHLSCYSIGFAALMLANASLAATSPVKPPPLPRGSEKVKLHPGQNPAEMARDQNAHRRPKKDKTLDDTRPTTATPAPTATTSK